MGRSNAGRILICLLVLAGTARPAGTTEVVKVATGAIVAEMAPRLTIPFPTAPAAWSPPPPTTGTPAFSPNNLADASLKRPLTSSDS